MENKIKRIDRKLAFQGVILDFYTDYMQMPDGRVVKWDFISHRKGAAAVVPVLDDGRILMVRQYRNALDRMTIEIPAGARDNTQEDTKICAARELEEEIRFAGEGLYGKYMGRPAAPPNYLFDSLGTKTQQQLEALKRGSGQADGELE